MTTIPTAMISNLTSAALLTMQFATGQAGQAIKVTDHRPLWEAVDRIQARGVLPINYEEAPYEHADDLEPVSDPRVLKEIGGRPMRVPKKGSVTVLCDAPRSQVDVRACLNELLLSYRQSGLPGDYRVDEMAGTFYVTGVQTRGADGKPKAVVSPMLSKVSIPYAKRRVFEVITLVAEQVSKTGGFRVGVGTTPNSLAEVTFGIDRATAREALAGLFKAIGPHANMSYRLLHDPTTNEYVLNFTVAPRTPVQTQDQRTVETGMPQPTTVEKWLNPARK